MIALVRTWCAALVLCATTSVVAAAQSPQPPAPAPVAATGDAMASWHFMSDGVLFGTFNRQGGRRGEREFGAQNWWMGMWHRRVSGGSLQLNTMLSLDAVTVGRRGYSEIFQAGERLDGRPIIDRQHPHDLLMQAAAVWRQPIGASWTWTLAGAAVGEPALGPVAFMHRASGEENPVAPLGHHTMDSTHIAMGVITTGLDRGAWTAEMSVFNGREPDERRWDLMDPGALDSWSARVWWRPRAGWEMQVSQGLLRSPEPLEAGDLRRTTASIGWLRMRAEDFTAASVVAGRNDADHGDAAGGLAEVAHRRGRVTGYARVEVQQVDAGLLLGDHHGTAAHPAVTAVTVGGVREVFRTGKMQLGLGADLTLYGVPEVLRSAYGDRPASVHVFLRLRPVATALSRMWNMTMTRPMPAPPAAAHRH